MLPGVPRANLRYQALSTRPSVILKQAHRAAVVVRPAIAAVRRFALVANTKFSTDFGATVGVPFGTGLTYAAFVEGECRLASAVQSIRHGRCNEDSIFHCGNMGRRTCTVSFKRRSTNSTTSIVQLQYLPVDTARRALSRKSINPTLSLC